MRNGFGWLALGALALATLAGTATLVRPGELVVAPEDAPVLEAAYAAPAERLETHVIGRGETLSTVLARAGITGGDMANLLLALREHLNPRRLRPSVEVTVRRWAEDNRTRAVELRVNADSTVRLDRSPLGWTGRVTITPTTLDTVYVSGRIGEGDALYESIVDNDAMGVPYRERAAVAQSLADVYGFKLDFFHDIQPGDTYRLVYEREVRPDGTSRRRRILVAEIQNRGRIYPAIYFNPTGDDGGYYDRDGESLQGMFQRYPLEFVRITSSFAWRRYHPILGRYRAHLGTDFGARYGTPVLATGDGTVTFAGKNGGYGNFIEIRHPRGYTTRYAHLSRFARGIRRGTRVTQGQVIAYVGSSGLATGPHLHYELRRYGKPLNPSTVELPGGPPIPDELRDEFRQVAGRRLALLDQADVPGPAFARLSVPRDGGAGTNR